MLQLIQFELSKLKFKYLTLTGSLNLKQRKAVLTRFEKKDKYRILLMTIGAGSIGLNLVRANHGIVYLSLNS